MLSENFYLFRIGAVKSRLKNRPTKDFDTNVSEGAFSLFVLGDASVGAFVSISIHVIDDQCAVRKNLLPPVLRKFILA